MPYLDINRNCKLCKEIDDKYPYYDFNTEECISKCTKVTYNNICYDNCNQIDNKHKYVKMKIMNVKWLIQKIQQIQQNQPIQIIQKIQPNQKFWYIQVCILTK